MPQPLLDLTGQKFGRLTVVEQVGIDKHGNRRWLCVCDCGKQPIVARGPLIAGDTKSCGCLKHENSLTRFITHGQYRTPEYKTWVAMKGRCLNSRDANYKNYGARGIAVCERWMKFENFIADMGPRPTPKLSLERTNNDLGYSPDNCKWATRIEQNNNLRSSLTVEYRGEAMTFAQAYRKSGSTLKKTCVYGRIRKGWTLEDALFTPLKSRKTSEHHFGVVTANQFAQVQ